MQHSINRARPLRSSQIPVDRSGLSRSTKRRHGRDEFVNAPHSESSRASASTKDRKLLAALIRTDSLRLFRSWINFVACSGTSCMNHTVSRDDSRAGLSVRTADPPPRMSESSTLRDRPIPSDCHSLCLSSPTPPIYVKIAKSMLNTIRLTRAAIYLRRGHGHGLEPYPGFSLPLHALSARHSTRQ